VLLASGGVLAVAMVRSTDGRRAYLVAGPAVPALVLAAARQLLARASPGGQPRSSAAA
jgi:hypothetical protein